MGTGVSTTSKSQSALLDDAEPVAASSSAFVVKFKYDIHCQMVAENREFTSIFTQNLAAQLGTMYEMLCIPEGQWLTLREEFIRDNGLNQKKQEQADMVQESGAVYRRCYTSRITRSNCSGSGKTIRKRFC